MAEKFDGQTSRMGLYTKMTDGTTQNGLPVYTNSDSSQYLFFLYTKWVIGPDYTSSAVGIESSVSF